MKNIEFYILLSCVFFSQASQGTEQTDNKDSSNLSKSSVVLSNESVTTINEKLRSAYNYASGSKGVKKDIKQALTLYQDVIQETEEVIKNNNLNNKELQKIKDIHARALNDSGMMLKKYLSSSLLAEHEKREDILKKIYDYYTRALEEKYPFAIENLKILASNYEHGKNGIPTDQVKALEYYRAAAHFGLSIVSDKPFISKYSTEQRFLFTSALGTAQFKVMQLTSKLSSEEFVEMLRILAENGNADAQHKLGCFYLGGMGEVPQDLNLARQYLEKAANQGIADAKFKLVLIPLQSDDSNVNLNESKKMLKDAIISGSTQAESALEAMEKAEKVFLLENIKNDAERGNRQAQFELGVMYLKGEYISRDANEGLKWLTQAANQGFVEAQAKLSFIFINGRYGVNKDFPKAKYWLEKASQQQENKDLAAEAMCALGTMYLDGNAGEINHPKAVHLYKCAAEQGNKTAIECLRIIGRTMEKNRK